MVQVGDILRVKDVQVVEGLDREVLNVWYFEALSVEGDPVLNNMDDEIRSWWYDNFLTELKNAQASQLRHIRCDIDNLMAFETEFNSVAPDTPQPGNIISDLQDSFTTFSLQLQRTFRTTRNGRKGLSGVGSLSAVNNMIAPSVLEDLLAFGETIMNVPFLGGGGTPRVGLRTVIVRDPVPPAIVPTVINPVSGVVVRGVGTQNTRKRLGS